MFNCILSIWNQRCLGNPRTKWRFIAGKLSTKWHDDFSCGNCLTSSGNCLTSVTWFRVIPISYTWTKTKKVASQAKCGDFTPDPDHIRWMGELAGTPNIGWMPKQIVGWEMWFFDPKKTPFTHVAAVVISKTRPWNGSERGTYPHQWLFCLRFRLVGYHHLGLEAGGVDLQRFITTPVASRHPVTTRKKCTADESDGTIQSKFP